ncbi:MAG TPA: hypothetical protein VF334_02335 [Polyangia bacterium]
MRVIDFQRQTRAESCLSDLALDRIVAGERVADEVTAHAAGCARCTARLDALRRARDEMRPLLDAIRARAVDGGGRVVSLKRRVWLSAMLPLVAAAALLLLFLPRLLKPSTGEREKGSSALTLDVVVRHADGHVEALAPDGRVRAGEAIRFLVTTPRPGHLVILGLDAAGKVSVYVADGDDAHPVARGQKQAMPGSIVLDATPGAERLVALECEARFPVAAAVDAGRRSLDRAAQDPRRAGALGLPGCQEAALTMDKSQ